MKLYFNQSDKEITAINEAMQGLEAIRNEDPNMILLDLAMPNFSGLDVVDYLKKEKFVESSKYYNIYCFILNNWFDCYNKWNYPSN